MISILNKILNKIKNKKDISLNEFLNIADITEDNCIITIDGFVLMILYVKPQNFGLLSEKELVSKMNSMSVEFANEKYSYKILVIPKIVDITETIKEQEELKQKVTNEIFRKIINNRINFLQNFISDKEIIENDFFLIIWEKESEKESEKAKIEIQKRANNWKNRLRNCELKSEILNREELIYLIKIFNLPNYKNEDNDYKNHISKIDRKELNVKNK